MAEGSGSIPTLAIRRVIRAPPETLNEVATVAHLQEGEWWSTTSCGFALRDLGEPALQYWSEGARLAWA
jgi:hypothetical protein